MLLYLKLNHRIDSLVDVFVEALDFVVGQLERQLDGIGRD